MNKKTTLLILALASLSGTYKVKAQTTNIPDTVFEQMLIDMEIDSDGTLNGQIATVDAEAITTLNITPDGISNYITNLTGIEAFTHLEELTIHNTMIEVLDVSSMSNLTYLDCRDNMLTHLDVSNNPLLEYLDISSGGDVEPFNAFTEIDLSTNPNISELYASGGVTYINLKNGNNNTNTHIDISAFIMIEPPETEQHVCIEVDDSEAAQNNQSPYSEWTIQHSYSTYALAENCSLSTESFESNAVSVYPNPASDILHINLENGSTPDKVLLFDLNGRLVMKHNNLNTGTISLQNISKGIYLLKVFSQSQTATKKLVIN